MNSQQTTATDTGFHTAAPGRVPGAATPGAASGVLPRSVALTNLTLFANLNDGELTAVMALMHSEIVPQGNLIVELEGSNTHYYIVHRGRAVARRINPRGVEYIDRQVVPGNALNELAFLTGLRSTESVEALEEVGLWSIAKSDFDALLAKRPAMKAHLQYPPHIQGILARMLRRNWVRPNEMVQVYRKRHPWIFLRVMIPIALAVAVAAVLTYVLIPIYFVPVVGVVLLATFIFGLIKFIDWQNDFYAVTDQRVVHRERVLLVRDEQDEIQLNKIQDVTVKRISPNPIENMILLFMDIGDVIIQPQGTHSQVVFRQIGRPDEVSREIFNQRARAQGESRVAARAKTRAEIRKQIGLVSTAAPSAGMRMPKMTPFQQRLKDSRASWRHNIQSLLPNTKLVRGNTITYRKHWIYLVRTAWVPFLVSLLYVGFLLFVRVASPVLSALLFETAVALLVALFGAVLFLWVLWRYEDWRNDIYILTKDRLIDIVRSPFGLRGTQRREAGMNAVQNVTATTKGTADMLWNVGDVVIKTGGADGSLNFLRVHNPRGVQKDIQTRQQEFEAGARERDAAVRRAELAEGLGIYDELRGLHVREQIFGSNPNPEPPTV